MKLTILLSIVNCHKTKYISYSVSKWLDFTVITFFAFDTSLSVWQNQFCVKLMWASADYSLLCVCFFVYLYFLIAYLYFLFCICISWAHSYSPEEIDRRRRVPEEEWSGLVWWWGQLTPSCVHLLPSRPPTPSGCCLKVFKGTKQVKSEKSPLLRKEKVKKRKFPKLCTPPPQ